MLRGAIGAALCIAVATSSAFAAPRADALAARERAALLAGRTVERPMEFDRGDAHFIGGVAYQIVQAPTEVVLGALLDVKSLPDALPRTKNARLVDVTPDRARIELVQGNSLVEARYTVVAERVPERGEIRFWLDRSRPHDIDDVWGYFRVQPFGTGKSLVTVGVALDLGPGLARMLFEDRIQRVILSTPRHIKDFIEPVAVANAR